MAIASGILICEKALGIWRLVINGCTFEAALEDFSCECGGELLLVTPLCCGIIGSSAVVEPGGTWISCGLDERECGDPSGPAPAVVRPKRKSLTVCRHVGEPEDVPGSTRSWRRCGNGHGSQYPDGHPLKGMVCGCATRDVGGINWRIGVECGVRCPGYAPPVEEQPV